MIAKTVLVAVDVGFRGPNLYFEAPHIELR